MSHSIFPGTSAAALAVILALTAPAAGAVGSEVQSSGSVNNYTGPLGASIFNDGTLPVQDNGVTWFRDRASGQSASFAPTQPHDNYPWPEFDRAGTGFVQIVNGPETLSWNGGLGVDFWIQSGATPPGAGDINSLVFRPNVSSNVVFDPVTRTSNLFKIATLEFTNGTWFGNAPQVDPGNGPLYGESLFGVSLGAIPDPQIGTPTFPWGVHQWNGTLTLTTTFGPNTPDFVSLSSFGSFPGGYFAVNEGTTGSVEVWGRVGSLLVLEYRNPVNGSIVSSIDSPTTPVPEPSIYLQMLLGIGVLTAGRKWRRRS